MCPRDACSLQVRGVSFAARLARFRLGPRRRRAGPSSFGRFNAEPPEAAVEPAVPRCVLRPCSVRGTHLSRVGWAKLLSTPVGTF